MNTQRLRELCDAVENGSARAEDVMELVRLARAAAIAIKCVTVAVRGWDTIRVTMPGLSNDYKEALRGCAEGVRRFVGM